MEIEYSQEVRGKVFAYRFNSWEKQCIAKGLVGEIKKIKRKIERVENDPKNEGQVTYIEKIREYRNEIIELEGIIKEFNS